MTRLRLALLSIATLAASPALAHTGQHGGTGFVSGFTHPVGGLDHVLAMVSVGLFAALLGGRALWALPASFVGMMLAGGALGMAGIALPFVELAISVSIVVLGAGVGLGKPWPVSLAAALVGAFAVFHGYAHGTEMPGEASAGLFALGFAMATGLLHGAGVSLGLLAGRRPALSQMAGVAVAVVGLALMTA